VLHALEVTKGAVDEHLGAVAEEFSYVVAHERAISDAVGGSARRVSRMFR
jgi:hypothetical protein